MFKKPRYLLILILTLILQEAVSQNSQVLYYMNLPQNHLLNPALRPSNSFYLGVPAITGVNIDINNNFVNFSDIIMPARTGDSIITFLHPDYNIDNFLNKLKTNNFVSPEVNIQLLGLGFKAGKDLYVTFDVIERVQGNFALPKDLFVLALKGNEDFLGKTINLSGLDARIKYFHEFGMGFSKNIGNKLRIGVRGKLLFGVANMSLNNRSLGLMVNDDYSWDFNADLSVNISGPVKVHMGTDNKIDSVTLDEEKIRKPAFFLNTGNIGLGLDIGAVYQFTDRISVSASITDLGYISWKKDVTNLRANSNFKFSGFDITDVINDTKTFDQVARDMADSLNNSFTITDDNRKFTTYLPVRVSVGGSYNLSKSVSLGILSHSVITGKQIREALTISANLNLGNAFSTSLCYTAENHRYDNIGAGLAFRLGFFQFYFITDRIPLRWNKITTDNKSISLPYNWNTINMQFGMNLAFGNKIKKNNDKPMLPEQKNNLK